MNEIEQRFYDVFQEYARLSPSFTAMDCDEEFKIADCRLFELDGATMIECSYPSFGPNYRKIRFRVLLEPQEVIGPYKVDFLLKLRGNITFAYPQMAIEIDGHEWHEKNKEQAAYARKRDREILARDISVLRFTGSEVYCNARKCIDEMLKTLVSIAYSRSVDIISSVRTANVLYWGGE